MKRTYLMLYGVLILLILIGGAITLFYARAHPILPFQPAPSATPGATFDETDPALIKLTTPAYAVAFRKSNGSIASITDRVKGQVISRGDLDENLWSVRYHFSPTEIDSSAFSPQGPARFAYAWSAQQGVLTFTYTPAPDAERKAPVTVTITPSGATGLAMQMKLDNQVTYATDEVRLPADLKFNRAEAVQALLPILPGIVLNQDFFKQSATYEVNYPGAPGVFADFAALTLSKGSFAIFSTSKPGGQFTPALIGFRVSQCAGADVICYTHAYKPRTAPKATWTSPTVMLRIGEDWQSSIDALRTESGIADSPSLKDKLGDLYDKVVASTLYKADSSQLSMKFNAYPDLLAKIPYPGILHLVGYGPKGFDRNYPDFIPPDPSWGSTQDLAAMFAQAKSMGFVVMPYTNPTWWDENSPTLRKLPAGVTINQIVALNESNMQNEECYGCPADPKYGYVVSPYSAFVMQRLDLLRQQIMQTVGADMWFEDQIGARPAVYDYNPASPSPDAYLQGWIDHAKTYAGAHLETELGFDRLVPYETGFTGSVLLPDRTGVTNQWWWNGSWSYYPFATSLARDKALFSQHDLAPETFTQQKETLAWNAAMGYMTGFDLFKARFGGGVDDPFIAVAGAFQRFVFARYASERVTGFAYPTPGVSKTSFEHYTVYALWKAGAAYTLDGSEISPGGFAVSAQDGSLLAGVFTSFHGVNFPDGEHYLIEERGDKAITVRQPLGKDTPLTLKPLPSWKAGTKPVVKAYTIGGKALGAVDATVSSAGVTFTYRQTLNGEIVGYYVIGE